MPDVTRDSQNEPEVNNSFSQQASPALESALQKGCTESAIPCTDDTGMTEIVATENLCEKGEESAVIQEKMINQTDFVSPDSVNQSISDAFQFLALEPHDVTFEETGTPSEDHRDASFSFASTDQPGLTLKLENDSVVQEMAECAQSEQLIKEELDVTNVPTNYPEPEEVHTSSAIEESANVEVPLNVAQTDNERSIPAEGLAEPIHSYQVVDVPAAVAASDTRALDTFTEKTDLPHVKSSSPKVNHSKPHSLHHIKDVQFKDRKVTIVTQNENGPCPLVAIINTLLLRRKISNLSGEIASAAKLMELLGNAILENVPKNPDQEVQLNFEQNMSDAMAVLPKLQTGLDVNVKFTGVCDFEYTPECIVFDLLNIRLYHGWLVDPQDLEVVAAVGQAGYNQLVEKVITNKCSSDADLVTEALVIESFLERSASQLTYHGLVELASSMTEGEVAVLFRNNHFSTILKHKNELLQLVTDQGFLGEPSVVWETLVSIDGDGQFVDGYFHTVPPKAESSSARRPVTQVDPNLSGLSTEQQIDQDFLVALSLQDEQPAAATSVEFEQPELMSPGEKEAQELRDAELARRLQEEEHQAAIDAERGAAPAAGAPPRSSAPQSSQPKKKDNCVFL